MLIRQDQTNTHTLAYIVCKDAFLGLKVYKNLQAQACNYSVCPNLVYMCFSQVHI